jgi:molybdate transport system substrate-binding protein
MTLLIRSVFALASMLATSATIAAEQPRQPLIVFAAASLTDSLQKVSDAYTKSSGMPVKLSFAASSALAKQIESGAQADVFFSADQEWMDYLDQRQLIKRESRADLLGNRLVLIAPRDSKVELKLRPGAPILDALGARGRLATGDPDSVPAGKYAKSALTTLKLWDALQSRLARAENVRVALTYVARGEAPLGIVYATDVAVEPRVRIVDQFPENTHPPITYPVAQTRTAAASAASFLDFLHGPAARSIFVGAGFKYLAPNAQTAKGCSEFRFDMSEDLKLFAGVPQKIAAGAAGGSAPAIQSGQLYETELVSQTKVRFASPPGKTTVAEGSYAGLLKLPPVSSGTVRVTLNEAAWVDVVDGTHVLESVRHTGSHDCSLVRKSVEFSVRPEGALLLQISGSTEENISLAVRGS